MIIKIMDRKVLIFTILIGALLSAWIGVQYANSSEIQCGTLFPGVCEQGSFPCENRGWTARGCMIICSIIQVYICTPQLS